jgi:hypothetical protein
VLGHRNRTPRIGRFAELDVKRTISKFIPLKPEALLRAQGTVHKDGGDVTQAIGIRRLWLLAALSGPYVGQCCLIRAIAVLSPACTKGFVPFARRILSADRYTGLQIRWTNNRQRRLGHDQFDPEGIPAPEIRRRVRLAQCVHAGLFGSGGCFGETRQLK